jgi:hypothetical protein
LYLARNQRKRGADFQALEHMKKKTKLRTKLESLGKGQSARVLGITSCKSPDYRRAVSTAANIRVSTGRTFRVNLGARALTITRTK